MIKMIGTVLFLVGATTFGLVAAQYPAQVVPGQLVTNPYAGEFICPVAYRYIRMFILC